MDPDASILLLSELPGVGEKTLETVLRRCAVRRIDTGALFDLDPVDLHDLGLDERAAEKARAVTPLMRAAAEATARGLRASGIQLVTAQDSLYPRRLRERMETPPPLLFAYGSLDVLAGRTFAVANSNGASEQSLSLSDVAAEKIVQAGWRPVTGHNRPAYQRTALAALRFGAPISYVLDRGLLKAFDNDLRRELFPAAHVWSRAYDPSCTLTISTFPLRANGIAHHNRRRDEIVFALADMVLVGEIRPGGQMERLVLTALQQKRTVCLVGPPSELDDRLLSAGAVRGPDEPG